MKLSRRVIPLIFTVFLTTQASAMLPPKYLSVPNWQACTNTITKDKAQFVCLPSTRPEKCSFSSWMALSSERLLPSCED